MVLILVVVDNGLVHCCILSMRALMTVLILVVVDNGLVLIFQLNLKTKSLES